MCLWVWLWLRPVTLSSFPLELTFVRDSAFESESNGNVCFDAGSPAPDSPPEPRTPWRGQRGEVNFTGTCGQTVSGFVVRATTQRCFFPEILQSAANFSEPRSTNLQTQESKFRFGVWKDYNGKFQLRMARQCAARHIFLCICVVLQTLGYSRVKKQVLNLPVNVPN